VKRMNPLAPDFWNQYAKFMETTLQNTQSLIANLRVNPAAYFQENAATITGKPVWTNEPAPEIKIDDDYVYLTFSAKGQAIDNMTTSVALEGYYLIIEGALRAKVALPVAVQKYGGKAVGKDQVLEVRLIRDRLNKHAQVQITKKT